MPSASRRKRTWRSMFILSQLMDWAPSCLAVKSTLALEAAKKATPAPGKVILEVEPKI